MSTTLRSRWLTWGDENNTDAQKRALSELPKAAPRPPEESFDSFDGGRTKAPHPDVLPVEPDTPKLQTGAEPVAVRLVNTVAGDVWVILDATALTDSPDILAGELPVFFADELAALAGHSAEELHLIAAVKRAFPGARIVQDTATGAGRVAA